MQFRSIHWNEGMFLRPQHFQAADRCSFNEHALLVSSLFPYNWGFWDLKISLSALENFRFVVNSIKARMPDGTIVVAPDDGPIPVLDLKKHFENSSKLTVFLAVPQDSLTPSASPDSPPRWRVESREILDENTGTNPEIVEVRYLNFKLALETENLTGFWKIPLVQLEKSSNSSGAPQISNSFIPPLLFFDIWPNLKNDIIDLLFDRVSRKLDVLVRQLPAVGFMSTETGRFTFMQLQALGEVKAILSPLVSSPGLHPFLVYLEFSKIIGKIGFFTPERVPPETPLYDHDQLGITFFKIRLIIESILNLLVEPEYKERPFIGAGLRMEVPLESGWVEKGWQMFIGVQGSVSPEQLVLILTQPGFLDLKVASSQRVDMVFRSGRAGLKLIPVSKYPIILPSSFAYFRILVESTSEEWVEVCKTLSLAFRLNEKRILGPIQDQKVIKIQSGADEISMDFTLFMVPEKVLAILEKTDISLDSDR